MHKMKVITGKIAASAASVVLAATAVGGSICPAVSPFTAFAEGQTADASTSDVSLSMGLSAGGSVIGISLYLDIKGNINDYVITLDNTEQTPQKTDKGWLITAKEYAMNMNNTHTVEVKKDSESILKKEVSVSCYLHTLLSSSEYADYQDIAKTMLRYGGAAQKYFDVDADSPVDSDIEGAELSNVTVTGTAFDKDSFNTKLAGKPVSYYGMNLSLRSETTFTLYFEINDAETAGDFLNGFTLNGKTLTAEKNGSSYYAVSVSVPASELNSSYTFTNGSISVDFSPLQYLAAAQNSSNTNLVNVCKALYAYGEAAKAQPQQQTQDPEPLLEAKNTVHSGKATYYDLSDSNLGQAMLNDVRGDHYYAAMNTEDYNTAMLAGAYIEVTGPKGSVNVYVVDKLPEGKKGDIDLDPEAFDRIADHSAGKVDVKWKIIPLDTASEKPMSFRFKDNKYNAYYFEVQVYDHKYPIYSLEYLNKNGEYVAVPREEHNYFLGEGSVGAGPYTFRITDIYGHVVIEENIDLSKGSKTGTVQFPD